VAKDTQKFGPLSTSACIIINVAAADTAANWLGMFPPHEAGSSKLTPPYVDAHALIPAASSRVLL